MTIFAPIMQIGWPFAMLVVFACTTPRRAILFTFVAGWLILPDVFYRFYGLPDYRKTTAVSIAALLGILVFDSKRLLTWRPSWVDLPLLAWCLVPIPTAGTHLPSHIGPRYSPTRIATRTG